MAVWTLYGECEGKSGAVMVDSVTMQAFGPVFGSRAECEGFLQYSRISGPIDPQALGPEWLEVMIDNYRVEFLARASNA